MKFFLTVILSIALLLPRPLDAAMEGGGFEIYADAFSVVQDQLTSNGTFVLTNTGGEAAGVIGTSATGTIFSTLDSAGYDNADRNLILSDGEHTVTFTFRNRGGAQTGNIESGTITIDTGGGANASVMIGRIAQGINSTNANISIDATSDGVNTVSLVNTRTAGVDGNVAITETVVDPAFVVTGMSGGGGSTGFTLKGGFQAMERASLSMSFDSYTVALGTLSLSEVKTGNVGMSVTTDSASGYLVSISEDGNLRKGSGGANDDVDDVTDGTVSAGSEEYGVITSGGGGLLNTDTALSGSSLSIASANSSVTGQATTITFKAAIGTSSRAGSYSHIVTFTATANP